MFARFAFPSKRCHIMKTLYLHWMSRIFALKCSWNFMLSSVEHDFFFITLTRYEKKVWHWKHIVNLEIFANSIKRHICDVRNSQLWHDIHISEWFCHLTRVLFPWNFAYAKFRKNKTLTKIYESTVKSIALRMGQNYGVLAVMSAIGVYKWDSKTHFSNKAPITNDLLNIQKKYYLRYQCFFNSQEIHYTRGPWIAHLNRGTWGDDSLACV